MASDREVRIKIRADMIMNQQAMQNINKQMSELKKNIAKPMSNDGTQELFGGARPNTIRKYKKELSSLNSKYASLQESQSLLRKKLNNVGVAAKKNSRLFNMNALGIMFFGMAMERVSKRIWQYGSKAFDEIMHSVEGTYTQFDVLSGSMKYLGFVVGQALEPLATLLVPIVDKISDWVVQNPKIVRSFVKLAAIMGTILAIVGTLWLGLASLAGVVLDVYNKALLLAPVFEAIGTVIGGSFLSVFAIVTAVIIAAIILWKTNFGGFRDYLKSTFSGVWAFLKSGWNDIKGIIGSILKALIALFNGDFNDFIKYLGAAFKHIGALLLKSLLNYGLLIVNSMVLAWNLVIDIVTKIILGFFSFIEHKFLSAIKWIINEIISLWSHSPTGAPKWLKSIKSGLDSTESSLDRFISKTNNIGSSLKGKFLSGKDMASAYSGVDKLFGFKDNTNSSPSNNSPQSTSNNNNNNPINYFNIGEVNNGGDFWDVVDQYNNHSTSNG